MVSVRRVSALGLLVSFSSLLGASSCLYESSNRCDDDQVYDATAGLCVCKDNTIPGTNPNGSPGCVPCAEHELSSHDTCVCEEGYERPTADGPCTIVPEAQGRACQSDAECTDATYDTCHLLEDGSGYCTNINCAVGECAGGYACDTLADPPYCARPPTGAGQACGSDEDCAGTEATWCDTFLTHVCYVQGCAPDGNDCPGRECCDLSVASGGLLQKTICVDPGTCQGAQ